MQKTAAHHTGSTSSYTLERYSRQRHHTACITGRLFGFQGRSDVFNRKHSSKCIWSVFGHIVAPVPSPNDNILQMAKLRKCHFTKTLLESIGPTRKSLQMAVYRSRGGAMNAFIWFLYNDRHVSQMIQEGFGGGEGHVHASNGNINQTRKKSQLLLATRCRCPLK